MAKFNYTDVCEVELEDSAVIKHVADNYGPDDVFPDKVLADWAEQNGYILESSIED